ncbi:protein FAM216A [Discoglossus pictus]
MERFVPFSSQDPKCQKNSPVQIRCQRRRLIESQNKNQTQGVQDPINTWETKNGNRVAAGSQSATETPHVKTVQIPRSMKNAAFLKHPDLTLGQKRYLCSIAKIYSTSHMRTLIDRHLHPQLPLKYNDSKKVQKDNPFGKELITKDDYNKRLQVETFRKRRSKSCDREAVKPNVQAFVLKSGRNASGEITKGEDINELIKSLSMEAKHPTTDLPLSAGPD